MNNKSTFKMAWLLSYISVASVSASIITPALPNIEQKFNLTTGTVEWVVSAFLIGYVIGQLIYGPLANVYGRLKALRWGLLLNLVGILICLLASFYPYFLMLLLGRLIAGLGCAAALTCTFMLINEWLPEEQRKTAMAYSILSFAFGIGLAVLIGGIITQYILWQGCFVFLLLQGIMLLIGLCVFDETLIQSKPFHIPTLIQDYKKALCSFQLLTFSSIWGACSAVGYCYSAAAPQIAHQFLQLSASEYGYWNTLNIIGMLIGSLSTRVLITRISVLSVVALGYLGSSLGLLSLVVMLYSQNHSVLWFFMSTCLLYCFSSYLFAGGSYMASNAIEDKASASSMMSFLNMSVATLSVVVMGYLSNNPFIGFVSILAIVFLLTTSLLIKFKMNKLS